MRPQWKRAVVLIVWPLVLNGCIELHGGRGDARRVVTCKEARRREWRQPFKQGTRCSLYILDLSLVARDHGLPTCREDDYVTELHESKILPNPASTGLPLPRKERPEHDLVYPFTYGAHHEAQSSGPWHFVQDIRRRGLVTTNLTCAAAVFVYDYCYFIWGLAEGHADYHWWFKQHGRTANNHVIQHVLQLYKIVAEMPKFAADGGRRFVLWQPHVSAFGEDRFWGFKHVESFKAYTCDTLGRALYLVPSVYQRWRCMRYQAYRTLVVPSASPNPLPLPPLEQPRPLFLFYKVTCEQPRAFFSHGKKFRSDFAKALLTANLTDSIVQCNEGRFGNPGYNKMSHEVMLQYLTRSLYCPVLPGDDQSSQHLTERYIAGCIPVFVGPPYHAMPFEQEVDYGASAVFINVSDSAAWLGNIQMSWSYPYIPEEGPLWKMDLEPYQRFAESPRWWMPVGLPKYFIASVPTLHDVLPYLRSIPAPRVLQLQAAVRHERARFLYKYVQDNVAAANQIILDNICHFVGKGCPVFSKRTHVTKIKKGPVVQETAQTFAKVFQIPKDPELASYAPVSD